MLVSLSSRPRDQSITTTINCSARRRELKHGGVRRRTPQEKMIVPCWYRMLFVCQQFGRPFSTSRRKLLEYYSIKYRMPSMHWTKTDLMAFGIYWCCCRVTTIKLLLIRRSLIDHMALPPNHSRLDLEHSGSPSEIIRRAHDPVPHIMMIIKLKDDTR